MRVKIGNQWHDSIQEPICIQVSEVEQAQIGNMDRSVATHGKFAIFPDSWIVEKSREWMNEEEVESKNGR